MPIVSVIVPVYNAENILHHCVNSIVAQTYIDFELILVDDGSTDNSGLLCDKYAEQYERVISVHLENGGVSKARNKGIELAKGEFICFVDSDDFVDNTFLEELLSVKKEYYFYDNVWCGFQTLENYTGSVTGKHLVSEKEVMSFFEKSEIMGLYHKWLLQMPWNKLFVTEIIKKYDISFPEELSIGEDLLFNLEYLDKTNGRIAILNKPLNYYIDNDSESLGNKYYSNLFEIYKRINNELKQYLEKWDCNETQFILYYNSCFFCYEKALRNTFHKQSEIKRKIHYNSRIIKSQEFRTALKNCNCNIHALYRFGYMIGSYRLIHILDRLSHH